ncbi:MAG: hypothetical protein U1D55_19425 [Phycisphaerae bacterium]
MSAVEPSSHGQDAHQARQQLRGDHRSPILELLKITPETPLEVSTDGKTLTIALADAKRPRVVARLDRTNRRHGQALRKLAE